MLRIRSWEKWQGRAMKELLAKRRVRGQDLGLPVALIYFRMATHLGKEFLHFARLVRGRAAETFLVRVLQYLAERGSREGSVEVSRERWGAVVLSREWDRVTLKVGQRVHDALIESGIAVSTPHADLFNSLSLETGPEAGPRTDPPPVRGHVRAQMREEKMRVEDPSSDPPSTNPSSLDPAMAPKDRKRAPTEGGEEGAEEGPKNESGCAACVDGLRVKLRPPECCSCTRGRQRARAYRKAAQADRSQERRTVSRRAEKPTTAGPQPAGGFIQEHLEKLQRPDESKGES